ncbi:MAG: hypothetical protein QM784_39825 [Polyangiaceae bacterium]
MSSVSSYVPLAQTAVTGIAKAFDKANVAAEQVARAAVEFSSTDVVNVSPEAVAAARSGGTMPKGDIERPMIDLRVAKYAAVANMRVLATADQLAETVTEIAGRSNKSR